MLHFLRHIRQKLILQENVRKYLIYAIGEITLVMIGILLALQVNNWNEDRKLLNEEQFILKELHQEFSTNLELIRRDYRGNKATQDALLQMLSLFEDPGPQHQQALDSLIVNVFTTTSYDATTGVVDEIIGNGRLNVLRNDSLRYLISQWPSILSNQQEDIDIRWGHFEQFLLPAIIRHYPIKNTNRYFNFSFWSEVYRRVALPKSGFSFNPDAFFTEEMEGLIFVHSMNQDFILMNDIETEKYIQEILTQINHSLN